MTADEMFLLQNDSDRSFQVSVVPMLGLGLGL